LTHNAKILSNINDVPRADWNALLPARGTKKYHPFTDWDFLNALEISGCVGVGTGWQAAHIWLDDDQNNSKGCAPLYVKSHSMGEYVFDQGWADAAERAGLDYYPKLQCAVPFTPVAGPRLIATTPAAETVLVGALKDICHQNNMSGVHLTFGGKDLVERLSEQSFLIRTDRQFHFINRNYKDFDDFLSSLTSRKRKKIKSERRKTQEHVQIKRLRGDDIKPEHWDVFYKFYLDTSARKWGRPYLTRAFFAAIHETMGEQVLLVLAYQDDTPIAGALNFIGGDALYGRHWGALIDVPFLHFELCYYQAIEAAIDMKLSRVEAGAQGEHKLARGYEPVATYSAHYLTHPGLQDAIANFLVQERRAVARHIDVLGEHTPFRKG
jgi:uncharacterized protein